MAELALVCEFTLTTLRGRPVDVIHPGQVAELRDLCDTCGYLRLAAGPCVYATVDLSAGREAR